MPDEEELFTIDYPARDADEVWPALRRALATMDLEDPDDAERTARFSTGVSLTSWGEHMIARVTEAPTGGARIAGGAAGPEGLGRRRTGQELRQLTARRTRLVLR